MRQVKEQLRGLRKIGRRKRTRPTAGIDRHHLPRNEALRQPAAIGEPLPQGICIARLQCRNQLAVVAPRRFLERFGISALEPEEKVPVERSEVCEARLVQRRLRQPVETILSHQPSSTP